MRGKGRPVSEAGVPYLRRKAGLASLASQSFVASDSLREGFCERARMYGKLYAYMEQYISNEELQSNPVLILRCPASSKGR